MGGQQQGGGFMQRMQQGIQRPQFQQGMAGLGAQMMGLDPSLGQMAAQGMQGRRMQQGFARSIQPIAREKLPVQLPGLQPEALMPMRKPTIPSLGAGGSRLPIGTGAALGGTPGAESLGGGAWQDPRLLEMLRGRNFQRY
jgi:hypothetical protein